MGLNRGSIEAVRQDGSRYVTSNAYSREQLYAFAKTEAKYSQVFYVGGRKVTSDHTLDQQLYEIIDGK